MLELERCSQEYVKWTPESRQSKLVDVTSDTITKIEESGYRLTGTEGAGAFFDTTLRNSQFNLVRTNDGQGYPKAYVHISKPFYPHFAFPLTKGKGWTQKVELTWSSHPSVLITFNALEAEAVGWEMVTVPAGNFQALGIELSCWTWSSRAPPTPTSMTFGCY